MRVVLAALLAIAVPFQGALAVSVSQCMALEHHADSSMHEHDGHQPSDSHHGKDAGSHCGSCAACCTATAIAGAEQIADRLSSQGALVAQPALPLLGDLPARLDRPPRIAPSTLAPPHRLDAAASAPVCAPVLRW